jgi:hypothetical protein
VARLGHVLFHFGESSNNFGGTKTAMTAEGSDGVDTAGTSPARHRLWVNPEHLCHLGRGEELFLCVDLSHGVAFRWFVRDGCDGTE